MANTVQLKKNGQIVYPITDRSCIIGLEEGPVMSCRYAWDGTTTPDVTKIPAGVTVEYNSNTYIGTLAASASTVGYQYLVYNTTSTEFDRYATDATGGSYAWKPMGDTTIQSPDIADNLTTNDSTKALSAKQGKILNEELEGLEAEVHNLSGKFYGIFADDSDLPEGDAVGYAFVGTESPFAVWNFDGDEWADTGATVNGVTGEPGVGFASVESPTPADGTVTITLSNGDTMTLDLNHNHNSAGTTQPSGGFLPDVVYHLGELSGTVTFALGSAVTGKINHYFWTFSTGASAPTINFPNDITWAAGAAPTVASSKYYEISVLNGIAYYSEV